MSAPKTAREIAALPEFIADFPTTPNKVLAKRYGCADTKIEAAGAIAGLRKSAKYRAMAGLANHGLQDFSPTRTAVLAAIKGKPAGLTRGEIVKATGINTHAVGRMLDKLKGKDLFCGQRPHTFSRWFERKEWATQYVVTQPGEPRLTTATQPEYRQPAWNTSNRPNDAHARLTAADRAKLPAVGMDKAVRTVSAWLGYDPRYQVDPNAKVYGAGFSAVGIGRDVDTGRAWGQGA